MVGREDVVVVRTKWRDGCGVGRIFWWGGLSAFGADGGAERGLRTGLPRLFQVGQRLTRLF